jgi:hypothetical protein
MKPFIPLAVQARYKAIEWLTENDIENIPETDLETYDFQSEVDGLHSTRLIHIPTGLTGTAYGRATPEEAKIAAINSIKWKLDLYKNGEPG